MAAELEARGLLNNRGYSLAHWDSAPRNILVNPTINSALSIIYGGLDWDIAVLAPTFRSCVPPLWIWAWREYGDEDERAANNDPPTPEARELKMLFEKAAGQQYLRFAYEPVYRLARRPFCFAVDGMHWNEHLKKAEAMLEERANVRNSVGNVD